MIISPSTCDRVLSLEEIRRRAVLVPKRERVLRAAERCCGRGHFGLAHELLDWIEHEDRAATIRRQRRAIAEASAEYAP